MRVRALRVLCLLSALQLSAPQRQLARAPGSAPATPGSPARPARADAALLLLLPASRARAQIDKSHPIIPRNDEKKAKKQAPPLADVMARQQPTKPKPPKPAGPAAPRKPVPTSIIKRNL